MNRKIHGIVATMRDITARKKAEKELKRSEKRYGTVFENTGTAMMIFEEDTTIEARIVAVAEAWYAMRTDRPYRDALPEEEALKELRENAGTQFDPEIVEIFLDLMEEN